MDEICRFYGNEHKTEIKRLEKLWENLHELEVLAQIYGISDIFQDNGAKVLQQLIYLNMRLLPGREGHDAISRNHIEWEMKSINLLTKATGFSTNHHTTLAIINNYRQVPWSFAFYEGIQLKEIYVMSPQKMELQYRAWEAKLKEKWEKEKKDHLNNPKIPVKFVRENGIKVYPIDETNPLDPDSIVS